MRSRRLPGLPVLALKDGAQLGKVKSVVVDPGNKRVAALIVAQRGWNRDKLLPIAGVHALGADAVTVDRSELLIPVREAAEFQGLLGKERVRIVGAPVFTAGGELVGTARDFEISGAGEVQAIYVSKGVFPSSLGREREIPGECVVALGIDALLVADEVAGLLRREEPDGAQSGDRPQRKPFRLFAAPAASDPEREE